jgi:hypothetical protein
MRLRRLVHAVLLLALLVAVTFESVAWLRIPLEGMVHWAYPSVALDREGRLAYYDHERVEEEHIYRLLDGKRNVLETRAFQALDSYGIVGERWVSPAPFRAFQFDQPRFLFDRRARTGTPTDVSSPEPLESVARDLNRREATRRGIFQSSVRELYVMSLPGGGEAVQSNLPMVEWAVDDGRLVCRRIEPRSPNGLVVAGVGPDGYVVGEAGAHGAAFRDIAGCAKHGDSWWLIERRPRRLVVLDITSDGEVPRASLEPIPLSVDVRPLHDLENGIRDERGGPCWIARLEGREHLLLLGDGTVFGRFMLDPGEWIARTVGAESLTPEPGPGPGNYWQLGVSINIAEATVGIETFRFPARPDTERRRLHLYRPGQPPIVHDVTLEPARMSEWLPANAAAALSLLRPAALNVLSAGSRLNTAWHNWWWRDPWLADGSYPGWLALSLALAGLCAWRARRSARERCATVRAVRFWTAAVLLLGPLGLLWMRLVLPRVPVEAVGGARRAVDLDASPSTDAPWPQPKPQGIEVFQ